jgi:hypothetical protein
MSIRRAAGCGVAAVLMCAVLVAPAAGAPMVKARDACDSATFNAVLGTGADAFIDRLMRTGDHPLWRFTPGRATVPAGQTIPVSNVGGEFHTFSRTVEFGGGFVQELNDLLGWRRSPTAARSRRARPTCSSPRARAARSRPPRWGAARTASSAASTRGCARPTGSSNRRSARSGRGGGRTAGSPFAVAHHRNDDRASASGRTGDEPTRRAGSSTISVRLRSARRQAARDRGLSATPSNQLGQPGVTLW